MVTDQRAWVTMVTDQSAWVTMATDQRGCHGVANAQLTRSECVVGVRSGASRLSWPTADSPVEIVVALPVQPVTRSRLKVTHTRCKLAMG